MEINKYSNEPKEPTRRFTGIWIPAEIWEDQRLTYFEKALLAEIHSLDGEDHCFASNKYFEKFFNERTRKIQEGISKLKKLGYVHQISFDGRKRLLTTTYEKFNTSAPQSESVKVKFNTPEVSNSAPQGCRIPHPYIIEYNKEDNLPLTPSKKDEEDSFKNLRKKLIKSGRDDNELLDKSFDKLNEQPFGEVKCAIKWIEKVYDNFVGSKLMDDLVAIRKQKAQKHGGNWHAGEKSVSILSGAVQKDYSYRGDEEFWVKVKLGKDDYLKFLEDKNKRASNK